jgi:RNA-binding protein
MGYTEDFLKVLLSEPHIILGKKGITNEFLNHTMKLLKRYKTIKIKALKSFANKSNIKNIALQVTKDTKSYLLDLRGFTFIISRDNNKKKQ